MKLNDKDNRSPPSATINDTETITPGSQGIKVQHDKDNESDPSVTMNDPKIITLESQGVI